MFFYLFLNRFLGSIFLISGTAIGAGMIGLPIKILGINFYFNLIIFFSIWLIMLISAIAMLEISFWIDDQSNIFSISRLLFGKFFSFFLIFIYIFFLYSLISAYISGISTMLNDLFLTKSKYCYIILLILFLFIFFFSLNIIDYLNRFLVLTLFFLYFLLILNIYNFSKTDINSLNFLNYINILFSLSIMITSFGYSLLIPSLKKYLFNNKKIVSISILFGSFIPFIIYFIWEYIILNFFLEIGNKLCSQTLFNEGNPTEKFVLLLSINKINIFYVIFSFSFFAMLTSFLGITLSMYDFFFDLFKFDKIKIKFKFLVLFLIFIFPLLFNFLFPYGFMLALSYAGIFASFLLILFPIYALWYGRYIKKISDNFILIKNKFFLFISFFVGLNVIIFDIIEKGI